MTDGLEPPSHELDWPAINRWRGVIDDEFDPGEWVSPRQRDDGVFEMGFVALSEQATAFVQDLYDRQVIVGFDWPEWMKRDGQRLNEAPELVADASFDDSRRLLIALVRGDRFNEGLLLQAFREGTVSRILRRTTELTATPPDGRPRAEA